MIVQYQAPLWLLNRRRLYTG